MKFLIDLNSSCFDRYLGFPRLGPSSAPVMNPPPPPVSCKAPSLPLMKAPLQTGVLSLPCPDHHSGGDTVGTLGLLIKVDLLEGSGGPSSPPSLPHRHTTLPGCELGVWGGKLQVSPQDLRTPYPQGCPQHAVPNAPVCLNPDSVGVPPSWIRLASKSPPKVRPGCRGLCPQAEVGGPPPESEGPSWHPPREDLLTTRAR